MDEVFINTVLSLGEVFCPEKPFVLVLFSFFKHYFVCDILYKSLIIVMNEQNGNFVDWLMRRTKLQTASCSKQN